MVETLFRKPETGANISANIEDWNAMGRYRDMAIIPDENIADDTRLFALLRFEEALRQNKKIMQRFQVFFDKRMQLDAKSMAARGKFIDARANILSKISEVFKTPFEVEEHIHANIDGHGFTTQAKFLSQAFAIDANGKIGKPAGMRGTEMMEVFKDADRYYAEAALAEVAKDMPVMMSSAADLERLDVELADDRAKIDRLAGDPNWREKYIAAAEAMEAMQHVVAPTAMAGLKDDLAKGAAKSWETMKGKDPILAWKHASRIARFIGISGMDDAWKAEAEKLANEIVHDKEQTKRAEFTKDQLGLGADARSYILRAKPKAPKNGL